MEITFTTSDCRLGRLLVAATTKGICTISVGKSDGTLERQLRSRFPTATVKRDDSAMARTRKNVEARIAGRELSRELPLDLHGTDFQLRAWKEMLRIPAGSTRSYADVARRIGRPTAYRAVAQACGANPVPIVVPCHRVIASGGKLGGYTGGLDRKLALLASEGIERPDWTQPPG